jgi:ankyrin repeat protein
LIGSCFRSNRRSGHCDVIELLTAKGADASSAANASLDSPLMWASIGGHVEAATLLLKLGASPSASNKEGLTPLMCACTSGKLPVVQLLIAALMESQGGEHKGKRAAREPAGGDAAAVLNARNKFGNTALHIAGGLAWCFEPVGHGARLTLCV